MFVISLGFINPGFCQKQETSSKVYEQALMKYVLAYEAFQQAKTDPNKKAKLPLYIRKYRESYAQYLQLMRENNLYDPTDDEKLNDPVGNFNQLRKDNKKPKKKFKPVDTSKARQEVRKKVDNDEDPEDIVEETAANSVPEEGYSAVDYEEAGWDPDDPYCEIPPGWDPEWPLPPWWIPPEKRGPDICPRNPYPPHGHNWMSMITDPGMTSTLASSNGSDSVDKQLTQQQCTLCFQSRQF